MENDTMVQPSTASGWRMSQRRLAERVVLAAEETLATLTNGGIPDPRLSPRERSRLWAERGAATLRAEVTLAVAYSNLSGHYAEGSVRAVMAWRCAVDLFGQAQKAASKSEVDAIRVEVVAELAAQRRTLVTS